jgi:hypothetical protein
MDNVKKTDIDVGDSIDIFLNEDHYSFLEIFRESNRLYYANLIFTNQDEKLTLPFYVDDHDIEQVIRIVCVKLRNFLNPIDIKLIEIAQSPSSFIK